MTDTWQDPAGRIVLEGTATIGGSQLLLDTGIITISSAEILAMDFASNPKTLIAGIAGKVIMPVSIAAQYKATATAYSNAGGFTVAHEANLNDGFDPIVTFKQHGLIDVTSDSFVGTSVSTGNLQAGAGPLASHFEGQDYVWTTDFGGQTDTGTGSLRVRVLYYLWTVQ